MARLFTVVITECQAVRPGTLTPVTYYEADFAGIHFSRANPDDIKKWARVAAKRVYGNDTQVIFLHRKETP